MPKDGTATRERILATAQKLVIDNGYSATSVEQVIAASGTSKGAFFHHFESKRALADALVDRYAESDLEHLRDGLDAAQEASDDPAERAIAFLAYYEGLADELMTAQSGCLYSSVLTELQLVSTGASDPIGKAAVAWREGYAALLRERDAGPRRRRRVVRPRLRHVRGRLPPRPGNGGPRPHASTAPHAA